MTASAIEAVITGTKPLWAGSRPFAEVVARWRRGPTTRATGEGLEHQGRLMQPKRALKPDPPAWNAPEHWLI